MTRWCTRSVGVFPGSCLLLLVAAGWAGCGSTGTSNERTDERTVVTGGTGGAKSDLLATMHGARAVDTIVAAGLLPHAGRARWSAAAVGFNLLSGSNTETTGTHFQHSARSIQLAIVASGEARLTRAGVGALSITPLGRRAIVGRLAQNAVSYVDAAADTDVVFASTAGGLEEYRVLRSEAASEVARYTLTLSGDLSAIRLRGGRIEVLDAAGSVAIHTAPAVAVDAVGNVRRVALRLGRAHESWTLTTSVDTTGLVYPVVVDPSWQFGAAASWPTEAVVGLERVTVGKASSIVGDIAVIGASDGDDDDDDDDVGHDDHNGDDDHDGHDDDHDGHGDHGDHDSTTPPNHGHIHHGHDQHGSAGRLRIDKHTSVTGALQADSIRLRKGVTISGDVAYNQLDSHATIAQNIVTPLALPLPIVVPAFPPVAAGAQNIAVPANGSLSLPAGAFGTVVVAHDGVLSLSGTYDFASIKLQKNSQLSCTSHCVVRIAGQLDGHKQIRIDAMSGAAADFEIFVAAAEDAATIGKNSHVQARIFSPHGTLKLKEATTAVGTFVGLRVEFDKNVQLEKGAAQTADCALYCTALIAAGCAGGPTDQSACVLDCETDLISGLCTEQTEALVVCAINSGIVQCDAAQNPFVVSCTSEQAALDSCEQLCATADDSNVCTDDVCSCSLASCDPATAISHPPLAAGSACNNQNLCDGDELCDGSGTCQPGAPVVVDDGNPCTTDTCDPATGVVSHSPVASGTPCLDANLCNGNEICDAAGSCQPGVPLIVDDGDPCTTDSCNALTGVSHTPAPAGNACADGDPCNGNETCNGAGLCQPGLPPVIDDANPCTIDACDAVTGLVSHTPKLAGAACPDANLCNGNETCTGAGGCQPGVPPAVDDGNPCTTDSCDPLTGVTHVPAASGTPCLDANLCNGNEACDGSGGCQSGVPPAVDDANPCTTDSCDALTGVSHTPLPAGASCTDGNVCNGDELCDAGAVCQSGVPLTTSDGDHCTADSCDPIGGVTHTPEPAGTSCADADLCNGDEVCSAIGVCVAANPPVIDDGDDCTVDLCRPAIGVTHHACSALDLTVATTLYDAAKFLFEGADPPQSGVAPGDIDPLRISVLRGSVSDFSGNPLPGVKIRALPLDPSEPSFGITLTQGNGQFDFAVNGGGRVTVVYDKEGFLPAQRQVGARRQDYTIVPDVVLLKSDPTINAVDLNAPATQTARGGLVSDADGSRQATAIFLPGTQAELVFANGSTQPVSLLTVRATEYTVGPNGPEAMPQSLPPESGYTYAVELAADFESADPPHPARRAPCGRPRRIKIRLRIPSVRATALGTAPPPIQKGG